jgi:protein transport protein SEC24
MFTSNINNNDLSQTSSLIKNQINSNNLPQSQNHYFNNQQQPFHINNNPSPIPTIPQNQRFQPQQPQPQQPQLQPQPQPQPQQPQLQPQPQQQRTATPQFQNQQGFYNPQHQISNVGQFNQQSGPPIMQQHQYKPQNGPPLPGQQQQQQQQNNQFRPPPTGPLQTGPLSAPVQMNQTNFQFNPQNGPPTGPPSGPPTGPPIIGQQNQPSIVNSRQSQPPTVAELAYQSRYNNSNTSVNTQPLPQSPPPQPPSQFNNNNRQNLAQTAQLNNQFGNMSLQQQQSISNQQFNKNSNTNKRDQPQAVDLLREKRLIQPYEDEENSVIRPIFVHDFFTNVNCHADTIRCTLTSMPETSALLSKCRLPLGILIHPFKDLESLKVVQSSTIVRCRNCRSYINPFVQFLDNSKWRCNMCYSMNDLPEEFLFDPVTRTYGDPSKRPEINSSTIEFIAPPEYTLRPPPPAMYLYLLDVSHNAITTGYLDSFCESFLENFDKIPGDNRTQIGFITYNSSIHFYNLSDSLTQTRMMIYPDLEDIVLPLPDQLMVNLNENKESIQNFIQSLPDLFADTYETDSALGTALNAGFKLLKQTGGRITVMQTCLPNVGAGALKPREENVDKDSTTLNPQTDFYKKLALECAGVHIAVDLFMLNSLYSDLATLSTVSKYSGGEIKYYPCFHSQHHPEQVIRFSVDFKRYMTRKIGLEAVMRVRCTRGLAIHTFHGNFFVRSTDLLALPNVNPDSAFGMQVNIEEPLTDISTVCFQAAILYTSSRGERRIRIHTYCLPVTKKVNEIVNGADQEAIIGLVSKMAVDRTLMHSLKEAKDALVNVSVDYIQAYSQAVVSANRNSALMSPYQLRLIPLYILALMKNVAFRFGQIKSDDRVYAMNLCKTMPLKYLMLFLYPNLYAVHNLDDKVSYSPFKT